MTLIISSSSILGISLVTDHCHQVRGLAIDDQIIIIIIIIITAIEFLLGGSSPYTSTDKTNKSKYT
jgi:hypothetical protein